MPSFSCNIDGIEDLKAKLLVNGPKARQAVKVELYQFAEEVMTDSKAVVPVLTGALMGTGKVMPAVESGDDISVTMGYGDEAVGYALIVHEMLDERRFDSETFQMLNPIHWTRPGSGPKFLENPLKAKQDSLPGRIGTAYKDALKS